MLLVRIAALGEVRTVTAEGAGSSPVVPAIHSKRVRRFWKIGAIHKKIHIKPYPPTLPVVTVPAESPPPLCSALAASCC